jgi:uncharacterized membrane protein
MSQKKKKPAQQSISSKEDLRAAKKAAVMGTAEKKRPPIYALLSIGVLVVTCGVYVYLNFMKNEAPVQVSYSAQTTGSAVEYPMDMFADGKARHFEYKNGALTIRYFIIQSSDGVIRAAFDACDVCWPAGKGYYQSGDVMVCRNCGRQFASVLVNEVKGGCNPAPLTRTVDNGKLIIQVKDILEGKQYFNFSGKA